MRAYYTAETKGLDEVIIHDICFSTDNCEDNTLPGEDCVILSGYSIESSLTEKNVSGRWKGVLLQQKDGEMDDETGLTVHNLIEKLKGYNVSNMWITAEYIDDYPTVRLTSLKIIDGNEEYEFPINKINKTIEFVSD